MESSTHVSERVLETYEPSMESSSTNEFNLLYNEAITPEFTNTTLAYPEIFVPLH